MLRSQCHACNKDLISLYNFGDLFLPEIVPEEHLPVKARLEVTRCSECGLVQLNHTLDQERLFATGGWNRRELNQKTLAMLEKLSKDIRKRFSLASKDWVLDIGTTDGYLLSQYPGDVRTLGVCAEKRFCEAPTAYCIRLTCGPFSGNYGQKFKVITSLWEFSRNRDPNDFIRRVERCLADDGVFILQTTDLASVMINTAIDAFRHDEVIYPTLNWLVDFLLKYGLNVFDAEYIDYESGNLRLFIDRGQHITTDRLYKLCELEDKILSADVFFENFAAKAGEMKYKLRRFITAHKGYVAGAFARGSTLLQWLGVYSQTFFPKAAEINKTKFGKVLSGTEIQVVPEDEALKDNPEYFFVLPWYLKEHFIKKYFKYLQNGGKLLFPLPVPEVCLFGYFNGIGDVVCSAL